MVTGFAIDGLTNVDLVQGGDGPGNRKDIL